jgi:penicillin-insensitive murein DD-endopeptidase
VHGKPYSISLICACLSFGCVGTVSPLAPGLRGSVGLPNHGVLTDGQELPASGPGFQRYRASSENYWGVARLVTAIQAAAARVAQVAPGAAPLVVGDLSARTGGKIPHHSSHRTGRDVDLLYYYTDIYGHPVQTPGFIGVGSDTLAVVPYNRQFVRLDVERQWQLTRALLTDPNIELLWMFVSRDIEILLVQQAAALGEPAWLVWRAMQVLHQPRDSAPHDDHMHLRIACSAQERPDGCEGGGPFWPWFISIPPQQNLGDVLLDAVARDEPLTAESEWLTSNGQNSALP